MRIAYISTSLPRECGIATFNSNLFKAISIKKEVCKESYVVAMTDSDDLLAYDYPPEVKYIIRQNHKADFVNAAAYINASGADVCIIEHEFGIYGGDDGVYVLELYASLEKKIVTILHTILKNPSDKQLDILGKIAGYSSKVVVMSRKAVGFLLNIYNIRENKIKLIEHGVPDFEPKPDNHLKKTDDFKDRKVIFTFGLLSRNKGLETVIEALPQIKEKHPNVIYTVLGMTHPGVVKNSGEEYRIYLKELARKLNVSDHLNFINEFVSEENLFDYLTAADLYITPYLNEAQITSGTLSYAVGAGAAIVSTPYWHAQEILAENRGKLFGFGDAEALAQIVNDLFDDCTKTNELKKNAYQYGKQLRWPNIGDTYMVTLKDALSIHN